ncbi:MAG: MaoC family dehydratase [Anaerolineales bacterium]
MDREERPLRFADLSPGLAVETEAREVTEEAVEAFARLTGDENPLHLDDTYAAETPFGGRIAHGLLVLSLVSGLTYQLGLLQREGAAFTALEWKYRAPVRIGDRIRARLEVQRRRALGEQGGVIVLQVSVLNQRDEVVQRGTWTALLEHRAG